MKTAMRVPPNRVSRALLFMVGWGLMVICGGCENKEKVLDIKAPGVEVEVNQTTSGKREVEIKSGNKDKIEIDTKQ